MNCHELKDRLPGYLTGEAGDAAMDEIRAHLGVCADCRAEAESMEEIWRKLGDLPELKPREEMRRRFYSMLEGYRGGLASSVPEPGKSLFGRWRGVFPRLQPAFQLALALALFVAGGTAGYIFRPGGNGDEIARLREEVHGMRRMVTLSLLDQQSAGERLEGVSWSQQVARPDAKILDALVQVLNHDPNVNVRLAAVDALYHFSDRAGIRHELVQSLARQTSPLVQIALIDMVVELKEKESAPVLRRLSDDAGVNENVRERARWGLQRLS